MGAHSAGGPRVGDLGTHQALPCVTSRGTPVDGLPVSGRRFSQAYAMPAVKRDQALEPWPHPERRW